MANKVKKQNQDTRKELAHALAPAIRRRNPDWPEARVMSEAFRSADIQIKRGEVRVS